jgi:hypothetical protein
MTHSLNLRHFPEVLRPRASEAFEEKDAAGFLTLTDNELGLQVVADNFLPFQECALYEEALLHAWTGCRTNWCRYDPKVLLKLFAHTDRKRLLALGDPLPGPGPFILYRGVAGTRFRHVRGLSWTADRDKAKWFAERYADLGHPAIYQATVPANLVFVRIHDEPFGRQEDEFVVNAFKIEVQATRARDVQSRS